MQESCFLQQYSATGDNEVKLTAAAMYSFQMVLAAGGKYLIVKLLGDKCLESLIFFI